MTKREPCGLVDHPEGCLTRTLAHDGALLSAALDELGDGLVRATRLDRLVAWLDRKLARFG